MLQNFVLEDTFHYISFYMILACRFYLPVDIRIYESSHLGTIALTAVFNKNIVLTRYVCTVAKVGLYDTSFIIVHFVFA